MFTLPKHIKKDTFLHKLNPRIKLSVLLLIIGIIACTHSLWTLSGIFLFILIISRYSKISVSTLLIRLRPFSWFFTFTIIMQFFFIPGESLPYFPVGCIDITYDGIWQGVYLVEKLSLLIMSTYLFISTTSPQELVRLLDRILAPGKRIFPQVTDISEMVLLTIKFIPILLCQAKDHIKKEKGKLKKKKGVKERIGYLIMIVDSYFESVIQNAHQMIDDVSNETSS